MTANNREEHEIKLEYIKWQQKIQEVTYLEAGQHMRSLNQYMWQVPSLVIAINGGLWYGATLMNNTAIIFIMLLVGFFDLLAIITLFRLRGLIGSKIEIQKNIESTFDANYLNELKIELNLNAANVANATTPFPMPTQNATSSSTSPQKGEWVKSYLDALFDFISLHTKWNYTVITCWSFVLLLCAVFSFLSACMPEMFFDKKKDPVTYELKWDKEYVIMDSTKV